MSIDNCKGCSSEDSTCTKLYCKEVDGNIYTCPCASCIVKVICEIPCEPFIRHYRIGETEQ